MTARAFIFFFGGFEAHQFSCVLPLTRLASTYRYRKDYKTRSTKFWSIATARYEAVNGMKYLEAVILESFLMYLATVASDRACLKPFELPLRVPRVKPYVVQRNDSVWTNLLYDIQNYPEPKKFNPDRFYDDPKQMINSLSFLSFGMGPRMCIGNKFALLETKMLLFYIFAKCDLGPCAEYR
ncbi:hypothetical protein K0M31_012837 [Melipona bicolor]|uniref:Cytochrome P450 n=1 Tax=Melipona bicolor TaxID=60889 RepID=A0AA40FJ94_9HYME|nr:hypothetical protein K0M31_012837 [Melipona bicolor]